MEINIPLYYILNRHTCEEKSVVNVLQVLSITPINCVIVTKPADTNFALEFSQNIIHAVSEKDAVDLAIYIAEKSGAPVLIIGAADPLDAFYADGTKQEIKC